jgi:predicted nucleotidyltransferase
MNALSDLFPKARAEILRLLFDDPAKESHLRDLARLAGLTAAALQRELANLTKGGLLVSRRNGNRLYFRANTSHPLYPELHGLVTKTAGIGAELQRAIAPVTGIDIAFIFGSAAAGTLGSASDVDLLILGSAGLRKVTPALRGIGETLGREINPHCLTPDEWRSKRTAGDAFISRVADEPKIWLKGDPDALATMGG